MKNRVVREVKLRPVDRFFMVMLMEKLPGWRNDKVVGYDGVSSTVLEGITCESQPRQPPSHAWGPFLNNYLISQKSESLDTFPTINCLNFVLLSFFAAPGVSIHNTTYPVPWPLPDLGRGFRHGLWSFYLRPLLLDRLKAFGD